MIDAPGTVQAPGTTAAPGISQTSTTAARPCRFCGAPLKDIFVDLGSAPLVNSYVAPEQLSAMEPFYPLCALVCGECFLVQVDEFASPERIFSDYAYFSSYSSSWLEHCRRYTEQIIARLSLDEHSQVVELASNDGYMLQYFREHNIPVLGIEPAANVAEVAVGRGVPTVVRFFGRDTARAVAQETTADLLIGNNVLAHVPDLNDFIAGMKILLKPGGTITMEFPHLLRLVEEKQWDTIYHEHFSYLSFVTVRRMFDAHGLRVFDVEEVPTHGGSLRIYGCHAEDAAKPDGERTEEMLARERAAGYEHLQTYLSYGEHVMADKRQILQFLIDLKSEGKRVVGYGAPAKGTTLLNYCGIRGDFLDYTVDLSPHKQGLCLPGSRIPIRSPQALREDRPDVVIVLPWNLREEIVEQHAYIREWGGRFAARSPRLDLLP